MDTEIFTVHIPLKKVCSTEHSCKGCYFDNNDSCYLSGMNLPDCGGDSHIIFVHAYAETPLKPPEKKKSESSIKEFMTAIKKLCISAKKIKIRF